MSKNGRARVLTPEQTQQLFEQIKKHRHPEKNALIMQLSLKLGLRVQEIALLRITEVAIIGPEFQKGYKIKDTLVLPKGFTKGARAKQRSQATQRRSVRFSVPEFEKLVDDIASKARAGESINPADFYPKQKTSGGKTRELPMSDPALREAIEAYLDHRLFIGHQIKPGDPLILSQKGNAYSPNTLQEHMGMMLRRWANIERATSHSGRRTLATHLLHYQGEHLKTVQQILGHKDASTTIIYHELPESEVSQVLEEYGESYITKT